VLAFDHWREAVSKAFVPLEATAPVPSAFGGQLAGAPIGELEMTAVGGSAVTVRRTRKAIRDADCGSWSSSATSRCWC
jgi:hypothetical protein